MKARKLTTIEQYTNPPIMIDFNTGERICNWNASEKTEEEIEAQGFKEVELPKLEIGQQYSEIMEDKDGNFYCLAIPLPAPPPAPILFDCSLFKDDLKKGLNVRMRVLYPMYGVVLDNLKTPMQDIHFQTIKMFLGWWKQDNSITDTDYNVFIQCFANQNINLDNY